MGLDLKARLETVRRNSPYSCEFGKKHRINCFGTALFLAGLIGKERFVDTEEALERLGKLAIIKAPQIPCLVSFTYKEILRHLGVVTALHPLVMANRLGAGGQFAENESVRAKERFYNRGAEFEMFPDKCIVEYRAIP